MSGNRSCVLSSSDGLLPLACRLAAASTCARRRSAVCGTVACPARFCRGTWQPWTTLCQRRGWATPFPRRSPVPRRCCCRTALCPRQTGTSTWCVRSCTARVAGTARVAACCVGDVLVTPRTDCHVRQAPFALPRGFSLVMADVRGGSETPSMVRKVMPLLPLPPATFHPPTHPPHLPVACVTCIHVSRTRVRFTFTVATRSLRFVSAGLRFKRGTALEETLPRLCGELWLPPTQTSRPPSHHCCSCQQRCHGTTTMPASLCARPCPLSRCGNVSSPPPPPPPPPPSPSCNLHLHLFRLPGALRCCHAVSLITLYCDLL
jgi:hypothetical protein